mgnify:CR=1 FL=1
MSWTRNKERMSEAELKTFYLAATGTGLARHARGADDSERCCRAPSSESLHEASVDEFSLGGGES